MPDPGAREIVGRYDMLYTEKSNFMQVWQEIADHGLGSRDFITERTKGNKRHTTIYDTTFLLSAQMLSAALHALLTNAQTRWFGLRLRNTRLMEDQDVRDWLYGAEEEMIAAFDEPGAQFAPTMHEGYLDLPTFGNMCSFVGDRPGGSLLFSARPLGEICVAENVHGKIDTIYRKFTMTARQVVQEFGEDVVPEATKDVGRKKFDNKHEFLHCVTPRMDVDYGKLDPSGMPWRSVYVAMKAQTIVREGGFWEMPYLYARWSREAGQVYSSNCPGWQALPSAKMLNEMKKTILKAAQKIVDPPMMAPNDGVIFPIKTTPGSWNIYKTDMFDKDPVKPLQTGGRIDLGADLIEQERSMVRKAFHEELLPLFQKPYMTATEVRELANQAQRFLSPTLGRLQVELLQPMIERVFGIMLRSGRLPPVPPMLEGEDIDVEYVSPIARAQKESEAQAILDAFAVTGALVPIYPEAADNLNPDQAIRDIARLRGVAPGIVRDLKEIAAIREARAQAAKQQQNMAQMQAMAQAAGQAAPAVQAIQSLQ